MRAAPLCASATLTQPEPTLEHGRADNNSPRGQAAPVSVMTSVSVTSTEQTSNTIASSSILRQKRSGRLESMTESIFMNPQEVESHDPGPEPSPSHIEEETHVEEETESSTPRDCPRDQPSPKLYKVSKVPSGSLKDKSQFFAIEK